MQFNIPVGVTGQLEGLGDHNELPQQGPSPKTNLLHSGAVKKPSVDIIFTVINAHTHTQSFVAPLQVNLGQPLAPLEYPSQFVPLQCIFTPLAFNLRARKGVTGARF